jgi:hypothetical protein
VVQLFGQSITTGAHTGQSSTRNLHGACLKSPIGFRIRERRSCHQMEYAQQGVEGFLYVDFLPSAEAPGA